MKPNQKVEVRVYGAADRWVPGTLLRHEPYARTGTDGWYVLYPAKEMWECHGGWVPTHCLREAVK